MPEEPLVSIIIPVYNGEKTIERCLASIRNQTYRNIEVLIVNDGSSDHTAMVLQKYEAADPRFHVISKKNTGVSDSRNAGIRRALGKYIQFVDGDDWLVRDTIMTCVSVMELYRCDMIISDFYRVDGRKIYKKGHIGENGMISRQKFAEYMMQAPANFYYGVLWNKFFRADIIRKHGIICSPELDWCEDFKFNLEYLQYAGNIFVARRAFYYYVKTKGSLVDTQVNLAQTVRTKRILFSNYKALYEKMDLYRKNRLRIRLFYISFAMDKSRKIKSA